jgi:DMSO/TMAO reductase YedYZ molybdopterin-dependent catalytic subunit
MSFKEIGAEEKSTKRSSLLKKFQGAFSERPLEPIEVEPSTLRRWTRRDLLLFGAGALATLAVGGSQLPRNLWQRLGLDQGGTTGSDNKWLLNQALRLDDDVSTLLYSRHRLVPTYTKSQITPLKNNYNGVTPDPAYIPGWRLTLDGLSSGLAVSLDIEALLARHRIHDQITRLVCVEGWSAIASWSGLRFDDLLHAYPPVSQAKWAHLESSVNLDANGNPFRLTC